MDGVFVFRRHPIRRRGMDMAGVSLGAGYRGGVFCGPRVDGVGSAEFWQITEGKDKALK